MDSKNSALEYEILPNDRRQRGKGYVMRSIKIGKLVWLQFFITAMLCLNVFAAEVADQNDKKEVLTTLEQRMQKRISVDFRNMPMEDVIRIMAEQADVDIVKSPRVIGDVTTTLTNVPLSEALTNILAAHGYGYITTKNIIRVAQMSEITESSEILVSRIYRITYANAEEVERALQKFISGRGSISANVGTSNIIVTDTESKIKAIDTFVAEIDRITSQVLVEARIYDVTCTDRLDLGIEWSAGKNTTYSVSGVGATGPNPTAGSRNPFITGMFDGTVTQADSTTGLIRLGWLTSAIDIDAVLRAQKEVITAKLLANPRVLVLDNERAAIKIIREIPYQEITESSGGGSIGSISFREVGVTLIVTPHITRDDMVRLHVVPEFSVQAGLVTLGTSGGNTYAQPQVDKRTAESTLLLRNGQTMVLGGLRKKEVSDQKNQIPLLGDIPIIENFFKFQSQETIFSEVVVFITPHIIEHPVLNEEEKQLYKSTQFSGPCAASSGLEFDSTCLKN